MQHLKRHLPESRTVGSQFTSPDLITARQVVDFAYEKIKYRYRGERMVLTVDCGRVIGLDAVIALEDIPLGTTVRKETRIKREQGSSRKPSYTVLVAYGLRRRHTTKMVIVAEPIAGARNLHTFSSIYPGNYAPDFDDAEFWNTHAFIREK
jgi:hypothetical protein